MKNEQIISIIQAECNDFADKVMEIYNSENIMIQFSVFDEKEFFNDTKKGKEWVKQYLKEKLNQ